MSGPGEHFCQIQEQVKEKALAYGKSNEVRLIAVSKTYPSAMLKEVYDAGCRDFGENRAQEAVKKINAMPADCRWHFIGTLQKNKIGKILDASIALIHSVDTIDLAEKISSACLVRKLECSILLQVNTSGEPSKHGFSKEKWESSFEQLNALPALRIEGLMTMAPLTDNEAQIRESFRKLFELREKWKRRMKNPAFFTHLSMGMTHDYLIAIEEGATLLRVGTAIFRNRN
ncbi:MAG: YggS family pyridoxal phosphate-dependent enzyme [Candidatus Protochlamydia sp.]|nr:YggS family pyridoxal phosphate-dependent enzyme [Candidatus Protochlamydia sp.]